MHIIKEEKIFFYKQYNFLDDISDEELGLCKIISLFPKQKEPQKIKDYRGLVCKKGECWFDLQYPFGDHPKILKINRVKEMELFKKCVIRCSWPGCKDISVIIDSFYPYHQEYCLCEKHRRSL